MIQDKPKQKYWYKFYITECVLCGAGETIKERVFEKPTVEEKYHYTQFVHQYHFL